MITLLSLMFTVVGCGADEGDPADARRLANGFCHRGLGIDERVRPGPFAACVRRTLPSATAYNDCLAGAGTFAVESEMCACEIEAGWSPF